MTRPLVLPPPAIPPDEQKLMDAARRCSDIVNQALVDDFDGNVGRWVAIRLSDGGSDGVIYDTKSDAVAHQLHETTCAYVRIPPSGMPPRDARSFLRSTRAFYDAGMRFSDPDRLRPDNYLPPRRPQLWRPR